MKLITVSFETTDEQTAADALRRVAEQIEQGYTQGIFNGGDISNSRYDVEELCEYCDGTGETEQVGPEPDQIITKKCFNCQNHD